MNVSVDEPLSQNKQNSGNTDYSTLRKDIETLQRDFAKLSKVLLDDTRSGVKSTFEKACESSNKTMHQAEDKIRERPFLSLLTSFIVGLVLAKLLERS